MTSVPIEPPGRIAYVVSRFPKLSETFVLREMEELERRGWQIDVFPFIHEQEPAHQPRATRWVERLDPPMTAAQVVSATVFWLRRSPIRVADLYASVICQLWREPCELVRAFVALAYANVWARRARERDIVHVHAHFARHPTVAVMAIAQLAGISFSFTCHAQDVYRWPYFLRLKAVRAAFVVSVSRLLRDRYLAAHLRPGDRASIHIIRSGVELRLFRQRSMPAKPLVTTILAVARLTPMKGLSHLIDACAVLRDRGCAFRCRIIGDGPLRSALQDQIGTNGLDGLVFLEGARCSDEVSAALQDATVFVLPSTVTTSGAMEGVPVSLMEAMATGVPVVATRSGAIPELVEDERTGLLVESEDAAALATAILRLVEDPALTFRLVTQARRRIETDFDLQKNVAELDQLLKTAIAGRLVVSCGSFRPNQSHCHPEEERRRIRVPSAADKSRIIRKLRMTITVLRGLELTERCT